MKISTKAIFVKLDGFEKIPISKPMQNHNIYKGNPYVATIADLSRFESKIRILPKNINPKLFFGPKEHYVSSKFCVESISGTLRAIGGR